MMGPPVWRPTADERRRIRAFTCQAARLPSVTLRPELRISTIRSSDPTLNLALLTDVLDGSGPNHTDLSEDTSWATFVAAVPLTDDGRAVVEVAVYSRGHGSELKLHVLVAYAKGQITALRAECVDGRLIRPVRAARGG